MADLIKVNTSRLRNDVADIRTHIKGMRNEMRDLRSHNRALDAMWDGPSSEAFKMAFESDIDTLEQILISLTSLNEYEDNAREKYDECERRVGDLVSQVKV